MAGLPIIEGTRNSLPLPVGEGLQKVCKRVVKHVMCVYVLLFCRGFPAYVDIGGCLLFFISAVHSHNH